MKSHIMLVGGFNKAKAICKNLREKGYDITIVNKTKADCIDLAECTSAKVIYGDGSRPFVLEDANAQDMDLVIALTDSVADNLVICELAKKKFHVKRVVSLLQDVSKIDFFNRMGVDSVVCEIEILSQIIEQNVVGEEYASVIPIDDLNVSILELTLPVEAPAAGKCIFELDINEEVLICCVIRENKSFIPRSGTQLFSGDKLILSCYEKDKHAVAKELTGR